MTERVGQLQAALAEEGADALVLRLAENVLLATGYPVQIGGLGIAVVPRDGSATLLVPEYEQEEAAGFWPGDIRTFPAIRLDGASAGVAIEGLLGDLAREHGVEGGTIAFEGSFESIAPPNLAGEPNAVAAPTQTLIRSSFSADRLVDLTARLEAVRAIKTEGDLERLRTANEIAMIGLDAFKEHARPGVTEAAVMAEVEAAILKDGHGHRGARVTRAWATVCSGSDLSHGWQYFRSRTRVIEPDDVVMVELGTTADGYWADHTRTVVAGTASPRRREAYEAVRAASDAAFAAARLGATGGEVDAAARAACSDRGFEQFPHHTGHGVGFRYHESVPQLVPGSEHAIRAGHVIVTEPGIYTDELGGFRWEDDAVVTSDGAVTLATSAYGLDLDEA